MQTIIDHWPIALGALAGVLLAAGLLWRWLGPRGRYLLRVTRAMATDPRLPRPLRWMIGAGLVIKAVPGPDLGIDEILLTAAALWLLLRHRRVLRAILTEAHTDTAGHAPRPAEAGRNGVDVTGGGPHPLSAPHLQR